jgi:hypothetical protein
MARGPGDYRYFRILADRVRARRGVNELPGHIDARRRPARLTCAQPRPACTTCRSRPRRYGRAALRRPRYLRHAVVDGFHRCHAANPRGRQRPADRTHSNAAPCRAAARLQPRPDRLRRPCHCCIHAPLEHRAPDATPHRNKHWARTPHRTAHLSKAETSRFKQEEDSDVTCGGPIRLLHPREGRCRGSGPRGTRFGRGPLVSAVAFERVLR